MSADFEFHHRLKVALGPKLPGIGSWNWVGADTLGELSKYLDVPGYSSDAIPECGVWIIVISLLPRAVIYCPIDYNGSCAEIDRGGRLSSHCAHILGV